MSPEGSLAAPDRSALRRRLLAEREGSASTPERRAADTALGIHLRAVIRELEPRCLGLYWPHRSEFNAPAALAEDRVHTNAEWALPFARRAPVEMRYRTWDGLVPDSLDDCGIPTSTGPETLPDVVLVPCVGYTDSGHRLGYGGGYFDRWLGTHPQVCAVGVAWSSARIEEAELRPAPHDMPLTLIVTDAGVI